MASESLCRGSRVTLSWVQSRCYGHCRCNHRVGRIRVADDETHADLHCRGCIVPALYLGDVTGGDHVRLPRDYNAICHSGCCRCDIYDLAGLVHRIRNRLSLSRNQALVAGHHKPAFDHLSTCQYDLFWKMFLANTLTPHLLSFFDWNPLFHCIDQARGFAFVNYVSRNSNWEYAFYFGLVFLLIGMMSEFYTRKHASASWIARQ